MYDQGVEGVEDSPVSVFGVKRKLCTALLKSLGKAVSNSSKSIEPPLLIIK